jgi:microcystin-dependent protein
MSLKHINASNGSGEAVAATVESIRSSGSSVIDVDSVANWPAYFIATSGTEQSDDTLDPTTVFVFYGHVSGSTLVIDTIAPGYTDLGNSAGDLILLKPTTAWADNFSTILGVSHTDTGALATNALKQIYPVGSIYIETTGTNPATTFGFGTWTAFATGRTIIGAGTSDETFTGGATGGESNHTLVTGEMPSHNHSATDAGHTHGETTATAGGSSTAIQGNVNLNTASSPVPQSTQTGYASISVGNTGGGGAHNNLPPYIVTYLWNRTA